MHRYLTNPPSRFGATGELSHPRKPAWIKRATFDLGARAWNGSTFSIPDALVEDLAAYAETHAAKVTIQHEVRRDNTESRLVARVIVPTKP